MIPVRVENSLLRLPLATIFLLLAMGVCWVWLQGAGLHPRVLAATVCNLGLVPGELTRLARVGTAIPIGQNLACVVDAEPINVLTPLTSMFLHAGWGHLLGNALFLWLFGRAVEDSMGRVRFVAFYLVCGLAAAAAQVFADPASPVPVVGASGAISGVMGAHLVLYPRVRVHVLVLFFLLRVPAWLMLLCWIGYQVLMAQPQLLSLRPDISEGVAVWAHIGGFGAGVLLAKLFEDHALVMQRALHHRRALPGY